MKNAFFKGELNFFCNEFFFLCYILLYFVSSIILVLVQLVIDSVDTQLCTFQLLFNFACLPVSQLSILRTAGIFNMLEYSPHLKNINKKMIM